MLLLAALVVAVAYTSFGLAGFGSTVIAMPLLAHFFALKFAVPLLMLLDIAAFLLFGARVRERIQYREIGWLVPFIDRKSTRLNSSHIQKSRMPSSA